MTEITLNTLAQIMTERFDTVDKNMTSLQTQINEMGEIMTRGFDQVHEKFEQVDSKIENLQTDMSKVKDDIKILDLKVDLMGRHLKHVAIKSDLDMVESRVTLLEAKA